MGHTIKQKSKLLARVRRVRGQVEAVERECYCPVETAVLSGARHSPHRDAPAATLAVTASFINRLLRDHREGEKRIDSGVAVR